jgi:catechol 2,3-dioxygenase-like lactoylglutathione lyase family enzyme
MLTGHATVLLVGNVQRAADYYRDRLGFAVSTYEAAHYDGAGGRRNSDVVPPDMFDAYFWPDDVDALHAELEGRGATIIQPPTDQPYGLREFRVQDPDGHILAFGNRNT